MSVTLLVWLLAMGVWLYLFWLFRLDCLVDSGYISLVLLFIIYVIVWLFSLCFVLVGLFVVCYLCFVVCSLGWFNICGVLFGYDLCLWFLVWLCCDLWFGLILKFVCWFAVCLIVLLLGKCLFIYACCINCFICDCDSVWLLGCLFTCDVYCLNVAIAVWLALTRIGWWY